MMQRFADWLVYDIFGIDAATPLGIAVIFFHLRYDKDCNSALLYQFCDGHHQRLFPY